MIHVLAMAVLIGYSNSPDDDKPSKPQDYKPQQLIDDLRSDDRKVNDRALAYLMDMAWNRECNKLGDRKKDVVAVLIPYLNRTEARKNVLMVIGRMGPDAKAAVPDILQFIKRTTPGDDRLALVAQTALRDIGEHAASAVPALIESFQPFFFGRVDNVQYRTDLPITLAAIAPKDRKVIDFLRKGLQDREAGVRVHSAWKLWELGERSPSIKAIWSKALKDETADVRRRVGIITASLAQESPELIHLALAALKDADRDVRSATLSMLVDEGNLTQEEVIEALVEQLGDNHWYIRSVASRGLGKAGKKAAKHLPQLKKLLADQDAMVRVSAARALYAIDPTTAPAVLAVLTKALTDSSNDVRVAAAKGLGELGPAASSALPALRRAAQDEWPNVQKAAAVAIETIQRRK